MKKNIITALCLSFSVFSLPTFAADANLITNPSFESSFTGWKVTGSFSAVKTPYSGTYAARGGVAQATLTQNVMSKLTIGKKYSLSSYAKLDSMGVSSMISIRFKNSRGGILQDSRLPIGSTTYKNYKITFTVPNDSSIAEIYAIKESGANSYMYLDNLSLVAENTVVVPANTAPVIPNVQSISTLQGALVKFNLNAGVDAENNKLTYIKLTNPNNGTLTCVGGVSQECSYTPNANFSGSTTFSYKVNDGLLDSNQALVTINVVPATPTSTPIPVTIPPVTPTAAYRPLGVGGGGAMSGVSISPYANLWFVGTDMGTLFKSSDLGQSWNAVNHLQAVFDSDLSRAVSVGFSADGTTVFHAAGGVNPKRSLNSGETFASINMGLSAGELIKYWHSDSSNSNVLYAGTSRGLLKTSDKGSTWTRITNITEEASGTFIDQINKNIYHATKGQIFLSKDNGATFTNYLVPVNTTIRAFTGGSDAFGLTLAFSDNDGANACGWVFQYLNDWGENSINQTTASCGYVWISKNGSGFLKNNQVAGDHLKMAENDSSTLYTAGGKNWIRQYGTKVHVSHDRGNSWQLKLNQIDYDTVPYAPWAQDKLEWSAVALDIGWWDSGYESFAINQKNSNVIAASGYFFLHSSLNAGEKWLAPFTKFADTGTPAPAKNWITRGLEVISVYKMKFHPTNPEILYSAAADIGGLVSENHGASFRIPKNQYNSYYDFAFDPADDMIAYAAAGSLHDFPNEWHANAATGNGGIYKTLNRGRSWSRLTPVDTNFNRQFLSVGYDAKNNVIYGGTHETGIAVSYNDGASWSYLNAGLPAGNKIIPQIEVDPNTGNAYALLTGDAPTYSNQRSTGIYLLDVSHGATSWTLLRGVVNYPKDADPGYKLWFYPTAFAIDFNNPNTLWLIDYENNGNWLMTGAWKTTDGGATWNRMKQITHPTDIKIDPRNQNLVHVAAYYDVSGTWGNGGMLYTKDAGVTWGKNNLPALQKNARGVTLDPKNPNNIFYSYFGGGILTGANPIP